MDRDLGGDRWEGDDFGGENSGAQALHFMPVLFLNTALLSLVLALARCAVHMSFICLQGGGMMMAAVGMGTAVEEAS